MKPDVEYETPEPHPAQTTTVVTRSPRFRVGRIGFAVGGTVLGFALAMFLAPAVAQDAGGSSSSTTTPSASTTAPANGSMADAQAAFQAYRDCLTAHGVTKPAEGQARPDRATVQAARQACQPQLDAAIAAGKAAAQAARAKVDQCLSAAGLSLPARPTTGAKPTPPDAATRQKIQDALKACGIDFPFHGGFGGGFGLGHGGFGGPFERGGRDGAMPGGPGCAPVGGDTPNGTNGGTGSPAPTTGIAPASA